MSRLATAERAVPTILSTSLPDRSVRCGVCAHRCLVRPGRTGICGVRTNVEGTLESRAYGHVAAIGLDPIEKKPLYHVEPGALAYSIATPGCPFHCAFCQNWELAQAPRLGLPLPDTLMEPADVVSDARRAGARAIAYTYVEPTVFLEFALDTARLARAEGMRNLFITDGYATPEAIALLGEVIDAANVDLKSFDDGFYRRLCGARLTHVLDALVAMRAAGIWLEVTTLVIPGWNDGDDELRAIADWLVANLGPGTPWHLSRFHPAFRMRDVPPTPVATLLRASEIGLAAGLSFVYVGNAAEALREDTWCPGCHGLLIRRRGYSVRSSLTGDGACAACARPLEGIAMGSGARRDPAGATR